MDQSGTVQVAAALFVGCILLTWFLLASAPRLPRQLSARATAATVRLRLVGSDLLRDLRNELNVALREYDAGDDPYLMRVEYEVPSVLLRRYRKIMQLERFARESPGQLQKRIRIAVWVSITLTLLFFAAGLLAGLATFIGMFFSYIALSAAAVVVAVGLVLGGIFFVRPYMRVSKAELRGLDELRARPGLRSMAEALEVAEETEEEDAKW